MKKIYLTKLKYKKVFFHVFPERGKNFSSKMLPRFETGRDFLKFVTGSLYILSVRGDMVYNIELFFELYKIIQLAKFNIVVIKFCSIHV